MYICGVFRIDDFHVCWSDVLTQTSHCFDLLRVVASDDIDPKHQYSQTVQTSVCVQSNGSMTTHVTAWKKVHTSL
jgi:hypothetical protein